MLDSSFLSELFLVSSMCLSSIFCVFCVVGFEKDFKTCCDRV